MDEVEDVGVEVALRSSLLLRRFCLAAAEAAAAPVIGALPDCPVYAFFVVDCDGRCRLMELEKFLMVSLRRN